MKDNRYYRGTTDLNPSSSEEMYEGVAYTFMLFVIAYAIAALG